MNLLSPAALAKNPVKPPDPNLLVIGPRPGYTPEIGTLVSMLTYIQSAVFSSVEGLSQADLDYLFDAKANTIGALLMHLAATETYYSINTFENKNWGSWSEEIKKKWDPAMNLGDAPFPHRLGKLANKCELPTFPQLRRRLGFPFFSKLV